MSGVTDTGFLLKELDDIKEAIEASLHATISPELNLSSATALGQFVGIFASYVAETWEVLEDIYRATDPDAAEGDGLDLIGAITGAGRLPAETSTVDLTVNLDDGTTLEVGRIVSVATDPSIRFVTTAEVSNATGEVGEFTVTAESELKGPYAAPEGTLTTIETPQSGWNSVTNAHVAAEVTADNTETYAIADGQTLTVKVDGAAADTATFNATAADITNTADEPWSMGTGVSLHVTVDGLAQVVVINAGPLTDITAIQAAAALDAGLSNASAVAVGARVKITSDSKGTGSSVHVTGGSANAVMVFSTTQVNGTGDFDDASAATAAEVAAVITTDIAGATGDDNGGSPRITSDASGAGTVEVTGGTANAALGFHTVAVNGFVGNAAVVGKDIESEEDFRARREELLTATGAATVDAITADLRNVTDVLSASTLTNRTDYTDANGLPPHSVEAVVLGGTDNDVAQGLWDSIAGGIRDYGTLSGTAVDDNGDNQTVNFSRPTDKPVYLEIDVIVDLGAYADGGTGDYTVGDAEVKAALLAYGDALLTGGDVIVEKTKAAALSVSGVEDISATRLKLDGAPSGGDTINLPIALREISSWATSRITVTRV